MEPLKETMEENPKAPAFPIKVQQYTIIVDSVPTQILLQRFHDRVHLIVTQTGKPGTMISAQKDEGSPPESPTFSVRTLLGERDRPVLEIYARHIVQVMGIDVPLLLSIGLKRQKTIDETLEYDDTLFLTMCRAVLTTLGFQGSS